VVAEGDTRSEALAIAAVEAIEGCLEVMAVRLRRRLDGGTTRSRHR
jgi:hypothetical protein